MNKLINSVEQHKIQDSSKVMTFMTCPRQYFFEYILGWRSIEPNIHLVFGTAWHKAMEVLYGNKEWTAGVIQQAFEEFMAIYRDSFPDPSMDAAYGAKTPANASTALQEYMLTYANDHIKYKVEHIEVAGSVNINDDEDKLYFKMDTIITDDKGFVYSLEHKTTSRFTRQWRDQWLQKFQIGAYTHVLYCLAAAPELVKGIIINGVNVKKPEFERVPTYKSLAQMEDWLYTANFYVNRIKQEMEALSDASEDDIVLKAFPKNTESCTKYFGCPFADICGAWPNPLQNLDRIPAGYHVEYWDPRDEFKDVKTRVEL